jgi:hypothetical protein
MKKLHLGLLALTYACNGGTDTGNPATDPGEGTAGNLCDELKQDLAPDAPTALGFSARQVLDMISGEHHETLAWKALPVAYGPETGESAITLVVEPLGTAHLIQRSPAQRGGREDGPLIALAEPQFACADSIAVDVRLVISTAGGALNESVETTLEASSAEFASGSVRLPLDKLTGSFEADVQAPPGSVLSKSPELSLRMGFSPYGNVGEFSISSETESTDGSAVGQSALGTIAQYPAENFCGPDAVSVDASQVVRGLSVENVLERLNATSPATLVPSGAALSLRFLNTTDRVCAALGAPASAGTTLEFPGAVELSSSDDRIAGRVNISIRAEAVAGALTRVSANANDFILDPVAAQARVAAYAIRQPLDFSAYDGGAFEFSTLVSEAETSGALRAYGLKQAVCSTEVTTDAEGRSSSPGCAGTERIEIWGERWGG